MNLNSKCQKVQEIRVWRHLSPELVCLPFSFKKIFTVKTLNDIVLLMLYSRCHPYLLIAKDRYQANPHNVYMYNNIIRNQYILTSKSHYIMHVCRVQYFSISPHHWEILRDWNLFCFIVANVMRNAVKAMC